MLGAGNHTIVKHCRRFSAVMSLSFLALLLRWTPCPSKPLPLQPVVIAKSDHLGTAIPKTRWAIVLFGFCHLLRPSVLMQDYPKLDKFKDALKQAAQTLTTIRVVFADATANSGVLFSLSLSATAFCLLHNASPHAVKVAANAPSSLPLS